jgi:hypothetical protein
MDANGFKDLIKPIADAVAGHSVEAALGEMLNQEFPPDGEAFKAIETACHEAIADGWMCAREAGGIGFGRVIEPDADLQGFSVDVVRMADVKGPHHGHPLGEIDMVMPLTPGAQFDGQGAGWKVYGPGTAHHPTVSGGEALVLYLLPEGRIEFTR